MDLLHGKKTCVPLWPQGGTMVTENSHPPNRISITRGFYIIVTINSCYYYPYVISKSQHITLAFGEKDGVFLFIFHLFPRLTKSWAFCFRPVPSPRKDKWVCAFLTLLLSEAVKQRVITRVLCYTSGKRSNLTLFDGPDVAQMHSFMTVLTLTCDVRIKTAILGIWGYSKASDLLVTKCHSPAGPHSRPAVERSAPNVPGCCPVIYNWYWDQTISLMLGGRG